jgi:hypothetical protein
MPLMNTEVEVLEVLEVLADMLRWEQRGSQ